MRVININNGCFMPNYNYIYNKYFLSDKKTMTYKELTALFKHLKNEIMIISLLTTINENPFYSKFFPLDIYNNNYEFKKRINK